MKPLVMLVASIALFWMIIQGIKKMEHNIHAELPDIIIQSGAGPCDNQDYDALVALYNATNGPSWRNSTNWLDTCDVCLWNGVICNSNNRVESLELRSNGLSGELPSEIGDLAELQTLNLQFNQLFGLLPASLVNLSSSLTKIQISNNEFSGDFPDILTKLTSLEHLAMENNRFSGNIPEEIGDLQNLRIFYCGGMEITSIPQRIGELDNLVELYLSFNQITELIPELGDLDNIEQIYVEYNQLAGGLPPEIGRLATLNSFAVEANFLTGEIPSEFGNLSNLQYLHLGQNLLQGTLPAQLGYLPLRVLEVWNNSLEGCIPSSFRNLCDISTNVYWDGNPCLWQGSFTEFCAGASCSFSDYTLSTSNQSPCSGNSTILNATGGISYSWSTGETTSSITVSPLADSWYYLTLTTSAGCNRYDSIYITVKDLPKASVSGTDVTAPGGNDGTATSIVTGGQNPYTYLWNNGATTDMINDLIAGIYSCTVTDANGCQDIAQVVIDEPACQPAGTTCDDGDPMTYNDIEDGNCNCAGSPCPSISDALSTVDISCFGANDGSATVSPSGGQSPYTINWSNGASGSSISGLVPGSYSVTISDLHGCSTSLPFTIIQPTELTSIINAIDESIPGANDGAVDLTASGGTAPYKFLWNTGATTEDLFNLTGQNTSYSVTLTDARNCVITRQVTLQTGCHPAGTTCDDGAPNTYNDIEDGNCNCVGTPCLLSLNLFKADISCFGARDGNAKIQILDGLPPYSMTWSTGDTSLSINDLNPGTYQVVVTDGHGCSSQKSFVVSEPELLTLGLNGHDESSPEAGDGSIDLTISGGSFPYYYEWSTGASTQDIDMLVGENRIYSVTVSDSRGCRTSSSTTLQTGCKLLGTSCDDQNPQTYNDMEDGDCGCLGTPCENLMFSVQQNNISCFGAKDGQITINSSGGIKPHSFLWSSNSTSNSISGLKAGIYGLTITDATGCSTKDIFQILEPKELSVAADILSASTNLSKDGSIQLTISGGTVPYIVSWVDGTDGTVRENLAKGIYRATISDANGCIIKDSFNIHSECSLSGLACDDGDEDTTGDVYDDGCDCSGTVCAPITDLLLISGPICSGDSFNVSIDTVGLKVTSLTWSNGGLNTISARFVAGNHNLEVVQDNNCISKLDFVITDPDPLKLLMTGIDESGEDAKNGSAEVQVSGGSIPYQILWSSGDTSSQIQNLVGDMTYAVTVVDNSGCQSTDSIYIAKFSCAGLFEGEITATSAPIDYCNFFGSITIQSNVEFTEGTEFSLDGIVFQESPEFTGLPLGTYYPQMREKFHGCQLDLDPIELKENVILDPVLQVPDDCNSSNGSIVNPNPGLEIGIASSGPWYIDSITHLENGQYHLYARDPVADCIVDLGLYKLGMTVEENALQISSADANCGQEFGRIDINPINDTYEFSIDRGNRWYSNHQFFDISPGTYEVFVRTVDGCIIPFTEIEIAKVDGLQVSEVQLVPASGCEMEDGQILFSGSDLYLFSQDFGQTWSPEPSFVGLGAGKYQIWISDSAQLCLDSLTLELEAVASDLEIVVETLLDPSCPGSADGFIKLGSYSDETNIVWQWNNGMTGPEQGRLEAGIYEIMVSSAAYCSTNFEIELVDPEPIDLPLIPLENVVYCQGESVEIEMPDTSLHYQWYRGDVLINEGPKVVIARDGDYRLLGINTMNCQSAREFSIEYSEELFVPNFLLAAAAEVGQPTLAVEISWPVPDEVIWEVQSGDIIDTYLNQSTLVFADTGEYTVTLKAMRNGCMSIIEKTIIVQEQGLLTYPNYLLDESIKLSLYPNPNLGNFNTLIELSDPSELQIRVYNEEGMVIYSQYFPEVETLSHNVDIPGSKPGVYTLLVQSDTNWKVVSFVIE